MLSIERQREIEELLLEKKSISVAELSERFDVSFETIRRDLKVLEAKGIVEKSYGGAVLKEKVSHKADFKTLSHVMVDTKKKMAETAISFIRPGDCIYIDFSTTCNQIVPLLEDISINILTNSLEVMNQLAGRKNLSLFSTGGIFDPGNYAFMGNTSIQNLEQFHLDKAFISCRALSMERGISDKSEQEAELRKKIIESSNKVYLMVDHTKFNKVAFVRTCDMKAITAVITDMHPGQAWEAYFKKNNIGLYISGSVGDKK